MNRIYQGRVRNAELIDSKTGTPLAAPPDWNWETALWEHHALFQDAVNYYTLALAAMADGMVEKDEEGKEKPTAMAQFAEQMFGRWDDFVHKGGKRAGLKHSLARTLGLDAKTITRQQCIDRIFGHAFTKFPRRADGKLHDVFRGVIGELFPEKSRGTPQKLANEDPGWLCWKNKGGEPPAEKTYRNQQGIYDFMDALFQADAEALKQLSSRSIKGTCLSGVETGDDNEASDESGNPPETDNEPEANATPEGTEDAGYLVGEDAVEQLERCLATAKTLLEEKAFCSLFKRLGGSAFDTATELARLEKLVQTKRQEEEQRRGQKPESPSTFRFQNWKRSGPGKDNIRVELFVLFHCDGGSEFTATLLKTRLKDRYTGWLLKNDKRRYVEFVEKFRLCGSEDGQEPADKVEKARNAAANPKYKPTATFVAKTDFIPRLKRELGYIFPSFTAIRGFLAQEGDPAEANGACKPGYFGWTKFDNAAYEEAIKSPHQIRQKQKERDNEVKKLEELKKLYEGKGREKGKADDGEEEDFIPGGFNESGGDPRFAAMRRIHRSLGVADGADPKAIHRYGISQAALRGYEELREEWNKVVEPGEAYSPEKEAKLRECIAAYQRQHRDDMGDSRLFEELVKQGNWCIWQAPTPEQEREWIKQLYSTNIVRDYLRYCDVLEDLEAKKRPVQYTPADARDSRRLFDFKGASQGGFEHAANPEGLYFTTQIAVKCCEQPGALYRPVEVRIHYTAPRLLRDEARLLSHNEDLQSANWVQPLMRALGIPDDDTHDFKKHAVSLMPDWKPASRNDRPDRLLLNFVLTPKGDKFIAHVRQQMRREKWPWTMQFNWNGDGHDSTLRWPHEDWSKVKGKKEFPGQWFARPDLKSFRLLSVDLGQKQAGAYAIIEVSCCLSSDEKHNARFIGSTEHNGDRRDWYARVLTTGLLRLPGEDAKVYRPDFKDGKPVPGSKDFREELSGSAGRNATLAESQQTLDLLKELHQLELLDEDVRKAATLSEKVSFPEQNTKLLIALRRAQSFAGKLHRWIWFLDPQDDVEHEDQPKRRRTAIKEIAESEPHDWLNKDAHDKAKARNTQLGKAEEESQPHPEIEQALKTQLERLIQKLPGWLETVANRIYRSRRGRLQWKKHSDKPDCHLLEFTLLSKEERTRRTREEGWLAGQRGLSIERIEQLEELRKRCQSLNQMLRRDIGCAPKASRDESVPDPCPTILAKLEEIKEQRRNQTAHMILVQALGLTLAKPTEPSDEAEAREREAKDSHGEYVKADIKGRPVTPEAGNQWRGIVDFIVIEDLSRYRTSQGRAPRENSRLMKWCHRAIRDKLKQICEPFGLPLVETPAAYSSRFCSRTGVAGFRATELSGDPMQEPKWRWRVRKPAEGKEETKEKKKRREQWEILFEQVKKANEDAKSKGLPARTLLAPDAGGSIFIPISQLLAGHERKSKGDPVVRFQPVALEENQQKEPKLIHADINAAVNLGLRAVADPRLWSIHSRLRSERKPEMLSSQQPKRGRGKKAAAQAAEIPLEDIKPDTFFVSEKEKRKFGEQNKDNRIQIQILAAEDAMKASEQATDEAEKRRLREQAVKSVPKVSDSRNPNFFADIADLHTWIRDHAATLQGSPPGAPQPKHLVVGEALWGYVSQEAWRRCMAINAARLRAWGIEPPPEWTV
ncbi:MAG TPA: type V CRISPR-associated protein Cas12b [Methylomirabilota bacterium]|nr:type V CRISPR-associated protein Cas12b [Methylomirabilota bacterium]